MSEGIVADSTMENGKCGSTNSDTMNLPDIYVKTTVSPFTVKGHGETNPRTPMDEINEALEACSFGLFHVRLLCTSFFAIVSCVLVSNTTSFILPNAECDLNISLFQKGILIATPFIGMVLSSIVAGFLTDTFGRKVFLLSGFGGISMVTIFSAASQNYVMLVAGKFFEGLLIGDWCLFFKIVAIPGVVLTMAVALSPVAAFTSEYCHPGNRDRVMLLQSSFRSFGSVLLAGMSWGVLTQDWSASLFDGYIVLNTWNFYLLLASLWSMTACVLYTFLPESPKYLITQHKYAEARKTLIKMYTQNTGKSAENFPYCDIWKEIRIKKASETEAPKSFKNMLVTGLHNCKPMFKNPLGPYLALFCTISFMVAIMCNVLRLWFPQLSTIVEHYSKDLDSSQDLCVILDSYTRDLKFKIVNSTTDGICVPTKSGAETYINSIILDSVCFLPLILTGVLVNKVEKKYLLTAATMITIGCTFGLRWSSSKTQMVALFATDMALGQTIISLLHVINIEVFPTVTRSLTISMTMTSGRTGSLVGNVAFPVLLNMGCSVPFYTLASLLIGVALLSLLLPNKKK